MYFLVLYGADLESNFWIEYKLEDLINTAQKMMNYSIQV